MTPLPERTPRIAFYGDDFTGSTDALEVLTTAGLRTVLFLEPPPPEMLATYGDLEGVGVAGMTRSMPPDAMEQTLRPALAALRSLGTRHVHYKVCSTFDSSPSVGCIGKVIDLACELFGGRYVPLVVGMPPLGRHCVFGNLFARFGSGGELFRLDRHPSMSTHPVTPADESDLRLHLGRQTTRRIGLFDILKVTLPTSEARAALEEILGGGAEVVLFDVLYETELGAIGALIDSDASSAKPLFSVGSSGLEKALVDCWKSLGSIAAAPEFQHPGRVDSILVASGSCSPVTERQILWALEQGFTEVALDTHALVAGDAGASEDRATASAAEHLRAGRSVIVHTSKGNSDPRIAATAEALSRRGVKGPATQGAAATALGEALGRVVSRVVETTGIGRLSVAGGDTAGHVARALGIESMEMIAALSPGAPLCRLRAPGFPADGLEASFKGGQVGGPDYFVTVLAGGDDRGAELVEQDTDSTGS